MLLDWLKVFKDKNLVNAIVEDYNQMIDNNHWMFQKIGTCLVNNTDPNDYADELAQRYDKQNEAERKIRLRIIEHLSFSPGVNLGTSLSVFAGVREMDSLASYCMDLQEVAHFLRNTDYPEPYKARIKAVYDSIEALFEKSATAVRNSDTDAVPEILPELADLQSECNKMIADIMAGPDDVDGKGAVATTLTARYFKRIARLLHNITNSMIRPIHEISQD